VRPAVVALNDRAQIILTKLLTTGMLYAAASCSHHMLPDAAVCACPWMLRCTLPIANPACLLLSI
jgi:hypothetical protein